MFILFFSAEIPITRRKKDNYSLFTRCFQLSSLSWSIWEKQTNINISVTYYLKDISQTAYISQVYSNDMHTFDLLVNTG